MSLTDYLHRYKGIRKPTWQPPAFLFGPIWSVIYALMGVGAWQVWKHGGWPAQKLTLTLWVFQLVINLFWNPIFFLKHDMALALFDIGALWALVIVLIGAFCYVEPLAGYIQLPYLAWVTFASVLNFTLLKLNTQPVSCLTMELLVQQCYSVTCITCEASVVCNLPALLCIAHLCSNALASTVQYLPVLCISYNIVQLLPFECCRFQRKEWPENQQSCSDNLKKQDLFLLTSSVVKFKRFDICSVTH